MSGWGWTVMVLVVIGLLAVAHALRTNWRKLEPGDRANLEVNHSAPWTEDLNGMVFAIGRHVVAKAMPYAFGSIPTT